MSRILGDVALIVSSEVSTCSKWALRRLYSAMAAVRLVEKEPI
jgi:hypothetical protein